MSKQFYKYLADRIIGFFKSLDGSIAARERYLLKLDNPDMVAQVYETLYTQIENTAIRGRWVYAPDIYETYTLKLNQAELAIVSSNDMTDGFMTTLRNAGMTMLMLSSSPIDSIKKGTCDLTSKGMPFHQDEIVKNIREYIQKSSLSSADKAVLEFELTRKNEDIFSDKSSLFEYESLLSAINQEHVSTSCYSGFRLLEDTALSMISEKELSLRLKSNNGWYERIDRCIRFGNIEEEFEKCLDSGLIQDLVKRQKEPDTWDKGLTYNRIEKSIEKKKEAKNTPFEEVVHEIYAESPSTYSFVENDSYFIRSDGITASKQRKKNVVIFNADKKEGIELKLTFNRPVKSDKILCLNAGHTVSGKTIRVSLGQRREGCSFHLIRITDTASSTKYEYRICLLDIAADYLRSVMTSYTVVYKKKGAHLQVFGGSGDIIVNSGRDIVHSVNIEPNGRYSCHFDSGLCLHIDENTMTDMEYGTYITLELGGVSILLRVMDEPKPKLPITGLKIFQMKYQKQRDFKVIGDNAIAFGTDEFYAKEDYRQNLLYEKAFVERGYFSATRIGDNLQEKVIDIPDEVKRAYQAFMLYFSSNGLIPSLAYYNEELASCARTYVDCVLHCMEKVNGGLFINKEINDLMKLGILFGGDGDFEIRLTPFHPLNVAYQLSLLQEDQVGSVQDGFAALLSCDNLLPYIRDEKRKVYRVVEQKHSPEWIYYAPLDNKRFNGARAYVPRLVAEKIEEYIQHFPCLFQDMGNLLFRVNVINMGDCLEVLQGLILFISNTLKRGTEPDALIEFHIHVYGQTKRNNAFLALLNLNRLIDVYRATDIKFDSCFSEYDIANILSQKMHGYFHPLDNNEYEYAHITFYEMSSNEEPSVITSSLIPSGVMMEGVRSGVPSVFFGDEYKTGFGAKFAADSPLMHLAGYFNALFQVANTSNPYNKDLCISTSVAIRSEQQMDKIYDASNWVTFIDPKVDLNFFLRDEKANVLIIHYSDQYTSSSGYDAITVTRKSKQYEDIIREYLANKNVPSDIESIRRLIDMFNALNGDWLLRLISSNNQFPREKMSILSAVKALLAYYDHPDVIWVPLSLEELLRVSGATGLSEKDGLLSAKKLGFESGKTSDDILMVGLEKRADKLVAYIHPVEVKIGQTESRLKEAREQIRNTASSLLRILWPDENRFSLQNKLIRNFIMQLVIISCEKMKLYHIWDDQNWDMVLQDYRQDLLNENYEISVSADACIGKGSIIEFQHDSVTRKAGRDGDFEILQFTECDGVQFLVKTIPQIRKELAVQSDWSAPDLNPYDTETLPAELVEACEESISAAQEPAIVRDQTDKEPLHGIEILFGDDQSNGAPLVWQPDNTDKVLHTNTGIIGTMGTGKTQFTKSIITQLYRASLDNTLNNDIGILIFDYKGDYNESKEDFVNAVHASVIKLYHLPFNPLALYPPRISKPLLPTHAANSFKDTLSRAYALGPKQENALFNCIQEAYTLKGIVPNQPSTWSRTPPTFADVYRLYADDNSIKKNDSLAAVMDKLDNFEIFENDSAQTKSLFDLLHGVVVLDLSGYDMDIQNLVVAITLDLFYAQMHAGGSSAIKGQYRQLTKMILVDEADNFLHGGFPTLKKILKEGREFGVGTLLSTQSLKHFGAGDDDFSKYILTWVIHNVADLKPADIRFVFNTIANSPQEQKLLSDVKKLQKHYSIVKMGDSTAPYYIRDKAFWELMKDKSDIY